MLQRLRALGYEVPRIDAYMALGGPVHAAQAQREWTDKAAQSSSGGSPQPSHRRRAGLPQAPGRPVAADANHVGVVLVTAFAPQLDVAQELLDLGCLQDDSDDPPPAAARADMRVRKKRPQLPRVTGSRGHRRAFQGGRARTG